MSQSVWKIGIDIQASHLVMAAAKYQRNIMILHDTFRLSLPTKMVQFGQIIDLPACLAQLKSVKTQFPKHAQYRIALSPSCILQNRLKAPEKLHSLQEKELFVYSSLHALFPVAPTELHIDFFEMPPSHFLITAAKKDDIHLWRDVFTQAGCLLDGIDIMPCVIRHLASVLHAPSDAVLLYYVDEQWLVMSPLSLPFAYHFVSDNQLAATIALYPNATGCMTNKDSDTILLKTQYWQPLSFFQQAPENTSHEADFCVAVGLAARHSYDLR